MSSSILIWRLVVYFELNYLHMELDTVLKKEISALEFYLRHAPKEDDRAEKLLTEESGFQELLLPYFKPKSQTQAKWMNAGYERNMNYPEKLIHKISIVINVRSKSEAMILTALHGIVPAFFMIESML